MVSMCRHSPMVACDVRWRGERVRETPGGTAMRHMVAYSLQGTHLALLQHNLTVHQNLSAQEGMCAGPRQE